MSEWSVAEPGKLTLHEPVTVPYEGLPRTGFSRWPDRRSPGRRAALAPAAPAGTRVDPTHRKVL